MSTGINNCGKEAIFSMLLKFLWLHLPERNKKIVIMKQFNYDLKKYWIEIHLFLI